MNVRSIDSYQNDAIDLYFSALISHDDYTQLVLKYALPPLNEIVGYNLFDIEMRNLMISLVTSFISFR